MGNISEEINLDKKRKNLKRLNPSITTRVVDTWTIIIKTKIGKGTLRNRYSWIVS